MHVNAPIFPSPGCFPSNETTASALSRFGWRASLRWPADSALHVFIDVRKRRLDLWPPALRVRLRGRVRSHDFCKCMFSRARPWTARTSRTTGNCGWDDCHSRFESRLSIRGRIAELLEVRGREHRVSTFPMAIARHGDFAPTPIASGTSCRRQRSLPCPERRGKKTMPPPPARACRTRAAEGSCDAGFPRRNPPFTNPRGLPSTGRSAMRNGRASRRAKLAGARGSAFFTFAVSARGTLARNPKARP